MSEELGVKLTAVEYEVPLDLLIAAHFRDWGYPVENVDRWGGIHFEDVGKIRTTETMYIGIKKKIEVTQKFRRRRFLAKPVVEIITKTEEKYFNVGYVEFEPGRIVLSTSNIGNISYLGEIAARLQQALGMKVCVRLTSITSVPEDDNRQLFFAAGKLQLGAGQKKFEHPARLLIERLGSRFGENSTQVRELANCYQLVSLDPNEILVSAKEEVPNGNSQIRVECTILPAGKELEPKLGEYVAQELTGIKEAMMSRGIDFSFDIVE